MKFTIVRNRWRNSKHGSGEAMLLNNEQYQCCLGFCLEQLGVPRHQLKNNRSPAVILKFNPNFDKNHLFTLPEEHAGMFGNRNSYLSKSAISINDGEFSIAEKEARLIKLFAECGHEIEFVGEYEVDT